MDLAFEDFLQRLERVRAEIAAACDAAGRDPASVAVLPVTKNHPPAAVEYAVRAGLPSVGENRVQEARDKRAALADCPVRWELIGHLQTNKAKLAVGLFDRIQSVDRVKLIHALERHAADAGRRLPILLQVNAGDDPAKHGCTLQEAPALTETILDCPHLKLEGLMTIAPLSDDPDLARRTFENLRSCREALQERFDIALPELSMGMSGDLREAVAAGSTMVRIGTALYGARRYT
ncbi:MAG: YggS family pyridoxal phosphate-dependent enzyme [Verrucomicrobia bacterium]|nr:MAG: YggS family pyridoxal phosphate-dependent enzyme [Verrucomicrobiota bacterium]